MEEQRTTTAMGTRTEGDHFFIRLLLHAVGESSSFAGGEK
jgi:hypothetical protein